MPRSTVGRGRFKLSQLALKYFNKPIEYLNVYSKKDVGNPKGDYPGLGYATPLGYLGKFTLKGLNNLAQGNHPGFGN